MRARDGEMSGKAFTWWLKFMENENEWVGECMAKPVMEGGEGNGFKGYWKMRI